MKCWSEHCLDKLLQILKMSITTEYYLQQSSRLTYNNNWEQYKLVILKAILIKQSCQSLITTPNFVHLNQLSIIIRMCSNVTNSNY
jgi:hypothetical protein